MEYGVKDEILSHYRRRIIILIKKMIKRRQKTANNKKKKAREKRDRLKYRARNKLRHAVAVGHIKKPSKCSNPKCTKHTDLTAHHYDYKYPYHVIWLCMACHNLFHKLDNSRKNGNNDKFYHLLKTRQAIELLTVVDEGAKKNEEAKTIKFRSKKGTMENARQQRLA